VVASSTHALPPGFTAPACWSIAGGTLEKNKTTLGDYQEVLMSRKAKQKKYSFKKIDGEEEAGRKDQYVLCGDPIIRGISLFLLSIMQ